MHRLGSTRLSRPVPASAVPRLRAIAKRFAKLNGGHALTEATAVLTTHQKALTSATPGDFVPGSGGVPVYLVTMQGRFIVDASRPPEAAAPTGRYASLVLDVRTFDGLDMGVGDNPPPVRPESLGPDRSPAPARRGHALAPWAFVIMTLVAPLRPGSHDHDGGSRPAGTGRASVAARLTGTLWLHSSLCSSLRVCWMG